MAEIDVILPTYNHSDFLLRAIDSILKQTFQDFKLIIVNDGSTDKTKEMLDNIPKNDKIKIHHHEKNKNLPNTLNTGHSIGDSPYCTWVSTDNISNKKHLELLYDFITKNNYDLVQGMWTWNKNGKKTLIDTRNWKKKFWGIGNLSPAFLYKRKVWEQYNYDSNFHGCEDLKFFIEVSLHPYNIGFLESDSLVEYFSIKNSISGRGTPECNNQFKLIEQNVILKKLGMIPPRRS